jgi:signal transduction histidine kinase
MYLPLRGVSYLLTEEQVLDSTLSMQRVLYAWQGILLFVLVLTFTLYYFLKIPSFLYYSLLNLGILLFFFAEVGDYFMFFDRDIYDHIIDIKHLGNVLVLFLLPLFIDALTDIRKTHPVLWKALFYGIAIGPVLWAICLIPPLKDTYFMYYSTLYFIVGSAAEFILMLFFTLEAVRKKHRNALAVFIIYSVYFSAAFVNVILPNMGNMQSELQVYNTFIYGSLFEFVAFLSLLANETFVVYRDRTRLLEKQKAHQHEIIKAIVESQERERNRVGRELHDMIGANISVIKQQVDKRNKSLISIIERTIESVRTLSHGLVTPQIKDDEFVDEIVELCVAFSNMDLQVKSHFHNWYKSIDPKIATHLYRIVQELLQNAVKHSGASEVFVQFIVDNDNVLTLMYEDNGKGFDYYSIHQQDGLGLINIENRIKLIGARIFYDTKPNGRGTTIIIELDLKA